MKTKITRSSLFAFLFTLGYFNAMAQFEYVSPLPSSSYNKPKSTIILKTKIGFDVASLKNKKLFSVTGSISGRHEVNISICENGKTILLQPVSAFAFGEKVRVLVNEGIVSIAGDKIEATDFSFEIEPQYSAAQKKLMAEHMKSVYAQDEPAQKDKQGFGDGLIGFPTFTINTNTNPAPGNVFFSQFDIFNSLAETHYCIIKSNGDSVYGKEDINKFNNFELNRNGFLTLYDRSDSDFVMLDSNYYQIDSFQMGNGYIADVHEFQILPDGSHWMICYDPQIVDMTVYDPSYKKNTTVIGCVVQKLDMNKNVVFQWRSWDHFSILDGEHIPFNINFIDAVHANAIELEADGNILLSSRHMCEVTKINTTTGDIIWRMGGKNNQFTFINDTEANMFHYQHDVHRIANGNLTIFDNGNYHSPPVSYAKEYSIDEINKTATLVWSYKRTVASGDVFSIAMGSMQRLSNGNTFIDWGLNLLNDDNPSLTEVDVNKNIVWELTLGSEDAIYRAHRREWDPCSRPTLTLITVKNITSTEAKVDWESATGAISYEVQYRKSNKTVWKLKTTTNTSKKLRNLASDQNYVFQVRSICTNGIASGWSPIDTFKTLPLRLTPENAALQYSFNVTPNPFSNIVDLEFDLDQETDLSILIYDVTGRIVLESNYKAVESNQSLQIDMSSLQQGIYLMKVKSIGKEWIQKIIKQ